MTTKSLLNNFIVLLISLVLLACNATNKSDTDVDADLTPVDPVFQVVAQGASSNITQPEKLVITNQSDWESLWRIHSNGKQVRRPRLDFDKHMVIAVFAGQQPSGGYSITIEKLKMNNDVLEVYVRFHEPAPSDMVTLALTQPYYMVSTTRYSGKLRFRYTSNE